MKIKHVHIENFGGIKELDTPLFDKTLICGLNRTGKSTVRNAILWLMFGKLADGGSADSIRPRDKDGNEIDNIVISVSATIEVDGTEYVLSKQQKQKWVKKRGSEEQKYEGNENIYSISDIPKTERDYKAFISNIADEDTLLYGTNPKSFLGLDTKKRREKLLSLCTDVSNEDVAGDNPDFLKVAKELLIGTIEELQTRAKKAIKELKEEQKSLPARIDELSRRISEPMDAEKLTAEKQELTEKLEQTKDMLFHVQTAQTEVGAESMRLSFDLNAREKSLKESAREAIRGAENKLEKTDFQILGLEADLKSNKAVYESRMASINRYNTDTKDMQETIKELESAEYISEPIEDTCPTCKQTLPEDMISDLKAKQNEAREQFEKKNREKIARLKDSIKDNEAQIEKLSSQIPVIDEENVRKQIAELETIKADCKRIIAETDTSVDVNADAEYKKLTEEKDKADAEFKTLSEKIEVFEVEIDRINSRLYMVSDLLARAEQEKEITDRIGELTARQTEVAQLVANQERELDILDRFNVKRMQMITDKVNALFDFTRVVLFKNQINGGIAQVCEFAVDGIEYGNGLNRSDSLLMELDISMAFQRAKGTELPLFMDDSESVDEGRIPWDIGRQLIVLRRTDNEKLEIKEV